MEQGFQRLWNRILQQNSGASYSLFIPELLGTPRTLTCTFVIMGVFWFPICSLNMALLHCFLHVHGCSQWPHTRAQPSSDLSQLASIRLPGAPAARPSTSLGQRVFSR